MKPPVSHTQSKKEFNKTIDTIEKELAYHYKYLVIQVWHMDQMEKEAGKAFSDVLAVYMVLYRRLIMRERAFADISLMRLSTVTHLSLRRTRYAKNILIKLKLVKEARAKDKIGRNMKVITWLPFHVPEKQLKKLIKKMGYKLEKTRKSHTIKSDRVGSKKNPQSHPIKTEKSHPINSARVYKGNIDKPILKADGILKNKRGVRVKRNAPHGYQKPLLLSDPRNPKNKKYRQLAIKMMDVVIRDSKYTTIKPNEKEWTTAIRLFCERDSKDIKTGLKVIKTIIEYHDQPEKYYLTTIYQPRDLKGPDKLTKIGEFMKRVDEGPRQNNNNNSRVIIDSGIDLDNIKYTYL